MLPPVVCETEMVTELMQSSSSPNNLVLSKCIYWKHVVKQMKVMGVCTCLCITCGPNQGYSVLGVEHVCAEARRSHPIHHLQIEKSYSNAQ